MCYKSVISFSKPGKAGPWGGDHAQSYCVQVSSFPVSCLPFYLFKSLAVVSAVADALCWFFFSSGRKARLLQQRDPAAAAFPFEHLSSDLSSFLSLSKPCTSLSIVFGQKTNTSADISLNGTLS
jgi:hypothetical protein